MANHYPILGELDTENLQCRDFLGPGSRSGSQRIHKRFLNGSPDYINLSLDIDIISPEAESAFVTIPTALISRETLNYLGLSQDKANELWDTWTNWLAVCNGRETDPPDGYLQFTFYYFITTRLISMRTPGVKTMLRGTDVLTSAA
ncbi:hypothetical protein M426DRAFT_106662 [Hypoxylon sp. CI-4A]|nr:hypothetical protein M426DRAFT_106662 [Hypoxylon sp. CI-4A]